MRAPLKILILSALLLLVQSYLSAQEKSPIKSGNTDSVRELEVASVYLTVDENGRLAGTFGSKLGIDETAAIKRNFAQMREDQFVVLSIQRKYPKGLKISGLRIDSSESPDRVQVRYNIDGEVFKEDIVSFNPMLEMAYTLNPIRPGDSALRKLSFKTDEMYVFSMDIPPGYEVSEMPASIKVVMDNNDGVFEYQMTKSITTVNLRTSIRMARTTYVREDFEALHKFFDEVVKKHGERIVFKRKK